MERLIIVMILIVMVASLLLVASKAMAQDVVIPDPMPYPTFEAIPVDDTFSVYRYHMPIVFIGGG